jgi:outer membrane protein OmpA-like peptidoglycan-associated protein
MLKIYILPLLMLLQLCGYSQLVVTTNDSAEYYIKNVLLGSDIYVSNIKYKGMLGSIGHFIADSTLLGLKEGLILSTGQADSIIGPNKEKGFTSSGEYPNLPEQDLRKLIKGDKDLNRLCWCRTTDITIIEFDFIPINNLLQFDFLFASEEYPEFIDGRFNDVFALFLDGPGIEGKINLAKLPDNVTPISIKHVNHKRNKEYYRANPNHINLIKRIFWKKDRYSEAIRLHNYFQFDGITTPLRAQNAVIPFQKYHLKIAIADVRDRKYDSGVFLKSRSFSSVIDSEGKYFDTVQAYVGRTVNLEDIFNSIRIDTLPVNEDKKFDISNIYFKTDTYELSDSSKIVLNSLAVYLKMNKELKCNLFGYTDSLATKEYNISLSEKRAKEVTKYLLSKGIEKSRLKYAGLGVANPSSDNNTEEGRRANRRVEIVIVGKKDVRD